MTGGPRRGRCGATLVAVWLATVPAVACRELPSLDPGVCGNTVVDPGEDCDTVSPPGLSCGDSAAGARACRFVCDPTADPGASPCPAGWVCARGGICAHASGRYRAATAGSVPWLPDAWELADLDGDGIPDVLGAAAGSELRVRFGDVDGSFGEEVRRVLPNGAIPQPVVGDIDGDGTLEVVVPASVGLLVTRASADRRIEPVPSASYPLGAASDGARVWPFRVRGLSPAGSPRQALLVLRQDHGELTFMVFDPGGSNPYRGAPLEQSDARRPARIEALGDRVPIADLDGDGYDEIVLAFAGQDFVRVGATVRSDAESEQYDFDPERQRIYLLSGVVGSRGASLADTDGDGLLDLLLHVSGTPLSSVARLPGLDGARFGAPEAMGARFDETTFPLAAGDLDGDRLADFVTSRGFELSDSDAHAPRPGRGEWWTDAVLLDFDSDHRPDGAAITDRLEPVIHLYRRIDRGLWSAAEVVIDGIASSLRTGDFDGDDLQDVAFREGDDVLAIVFGESSGPRGPPLRVGRVEGLESVEAGTVADPSGAFDAASDLVATSAIAETGERSTAGFLGASSRSLDSPFALIERAGYVFERPHAVVFAVSGRGRGSLVALAGDPAYPGLWRIEGTQGRGLQASDAARVGRSSVGGVASCALWAAGDLDGDGADETVAAGPRDGCAITEATSLVAIDPTTGRFERLGELGVPTRRPREIATHDLDLDGLADLTVAYADGVDVLWSVHGVIDPASAVALPDAPDGSRPTALASIQSDSDPAPELAIAAGGAVWSMEIHGRDAPTYRSVPIAETAVERVRVADLNGDGIDDLVVGDGRRLSTLLAVPHVEPVE